MREKHWIPKYSVICLIVLNRNINVVIRFTARQSQNTTDTAFSIPRELYLSIRPVLMRRGRSSLWKKPNFI